MSSQAGGVHILQVNLAVPDELCASVVPWFKQILKVFVCGLAQHNSHILKVPWAKCANQCRAIARLIDRGAIAISSPLKTVHNWTPNQRPRECDDIHLWQTKHRIFFFNETTQANSGTIDYDITSIDRQGTIPIQGVANDNIALCEAFKGK